MAEAPKKSHYRGKARQGRRVTVHYRVLQHGELSAEIRAQTRNIGVGGAFIETADPAPPLTRLVVTLTLDGGVVLDAQAEVRWIMDGDEDPYHGMGVKFLGLDGNQQRQLNDYCVSLPVVAELDELLS
jgi:c-di-GMP-binding flagellar brake protein YcgR